MGDRSRGRCCGCERRTCCGECSRGCDCGCGECSRGRDCGCNERRHHRTSGALAGDQTITPTNVGLANGSQSLTFDQLGSGALRISSSPPLSGPATLNVPAGRYALDVYGDASLGSFPVTLTTGSGATLLVTAGQNYLVNVAATGVSSVFPAATLANAA